jgi:penicillin G amidase
MKIKKTGIIMGIFFAVLAALILPTQIAFKARLPKTHGSLNLPGLELPVEVHRDKYGIPHIEAKSELDAMRAFGFVTAGDRLFHMELLRRIANGSLSEVLGEAATKWDILLRKLKLRKTMDEFLAKNLQNMDPHMINLMKAFYEGVDHFVKTQPLPPEFVLLGFTPKKFELAEGMAISGYMALSFAEGIIADSLFSELYADFPKEMVDQVLVKHKKDRNLITESYASNSKPLNKAIARPTQEAWFKDLTEFLTEFEQNFGLFHGSNSWVLGPTRSKSGHALLANDPHVAFSNPSVWYEAHIKYPGYEIYGHYLPLVPFPAMGHDMNRGWAVTMAEMDDLDIYQEKIDWDKKQVMYRGKWVPLKIEKEIVKVKGKEDVVIEVVTTPHGPLIDGTEYGKKDKHLAIKWSYHHPENDVATAFYKLAHSQDLKDMKEAIKLAATPGLNVSWVDKRGNIAWHVLSKIPLRPAGVTGETILEGWSGKHEYLRYLTIDENPHLYNPKSGVIVTTNYYPEFKSKHPLSGYWQPSERFERISDLLATKEKWDLEDLKAVQNDQFVVTADEHLSILLGSLKSGGSSQKQKAVEILKTWDGKSGISDVAPSLYYTWTKQIMKEAMLDELGEDRYKALNSVADGWHFFKTFIKNANSPWWDNNKTSEKETREQIIATAFDKTLKSLSDQYGSNVSSWNWGRLHTIEFAHPFGKKKPLDSIFNIGPFESGGGYFQVDNMSSKRYKDDFHVTLGPSTRRLIDFKDASVSLGILPTGNSGRPFSPHYDDQVRMFLDGKYREQLLDLKIVKAQKKGTLTLTP